MAGAPSMGWRHVCWFGAPGCQYLSCLCCQWNSGGTAEGEVDYFLLRHIFWLYANGNAVVPPDEPGIGDMDGSNDKIIITSVGGNFLNIPVKMLLAVKH